MNQTSHSEYLKLHSVFLKSPQAAFQSDSVLDEQWKDLNYLSKPDFNKSLLEYSEFEKHLSTHHVQINYLPSSEGETIDSVYCRDASIVTDFGIIICNMGKDGRVHEPGLHSEYFKSVNIDVLGTIEWPGTLEGGDVAWLDQETLAVGHSYRTNKAGIAQLKALLEPRGITVIVVDLPHYKGKQDVFHLMSVLSPVDKNLAVVYSSLIPIRFRNELLNRGFDLVDVPETEFESMACNVLALEPRVCLMLDGNPITKGMLESKGCTVFTYKGIEISLKGGGGPTCLTRPHKRLY